MKDQIDDLMEAAEACVAEATPATLEPEKLQLVKGIHGAGRCAARLHLRDNGAAARAGRTLRRGTGIHHQLARSLKLRDLHAIAAGTDGRRAARVRARRTGARVTQEVQGSGLINRGLRAPFPL